MTGDPMKEHEHATINKPETKLAHDEVAKKAYGIYLKEGRPQGRDVQNWLGVVAIVHGRRIYDRELSLPLFGSYNLDDKSSPHSPRETTTRYCSISTGC